jgi:integrase
VLQPDGTIRREVVCRKLSVPYGDEYRTKASVRPLAQEILAPVNAGLLNPQSTMLVLDFVEKIYLPKHVDAKLRPSTRKSYRDSWRHIRSRLGKMTLRSFRTVHGEQMLADIARQANLGRSSLKSVKAFLSGVFKQAKRLGILDGINPIEDVSIPNAPEPKETYAYSLEELKQILGVLNEPAYTVVLAAALTGLRKGEIRGLRWEDFTGKELSIKQSVWNGFASEPKTARSKAAIPVVKQLAEALETHRKRMGMLAVGPIFQGDTGKPMNLDNLARRVIVPALERCATCKKSPHDEKVGHKFVRDNSLPRWHGWHAFRRGLATNLHELGVADKDIQAILRHSNLGITMNIYVKSVAESQVDAMDILGREFGEVHRSQDEVAEKRHVN